MRKSHQAGHILFNMEVNQNVVSLYIIGQADLSYDASWWTW